MKKPNGIKLALSVGILLVAVPAVAATPPKARISMDKAQEIATQSQSGTIESKELEHERGKWVYSFDIRGDDQRIHELQVDAKNGKIVSNKIETAQQEAKEAQAEGK